MLDKQQSTILSTDRIFANPPFRCLDRIFGGGGSFISSNKKSGLMPENTHTLFGVCVRDCASVGVWVTVPGTV
jgi:hypothetical protein